MKSKQKIIEEQFIEEFILQMKLYSSIEEVMEDLQILRKLGYQNSQNRGDGGFPIFKNRKQVISRMFSSSSNIASIGRIGPGNVYLVGKDVWDILAEYNITNMEHYTIKLCEKLEPLEVLCCRLFKSEDIEKYKNFRFPIEKQFSGFIAKIEE
jgi:hypothetical protein